jgi:parvulin-like peptidyl-prolyl isomerase
MRTGKHVFALAAATGLAVGFVAGITAVQAKDDKVADSLQQEVVARIGDRIITLGEFNRMLPRDPNNPDGKLRSVQKKVLLEQLVQKLLFVEGAKEMRLAERPEVAARIEQTVTNLLAGEYARLQVIEQVKVKEDEVRAYWRDHPEEYKAPLQVHARHILIAVPERDGNDADARKRAEEILARVRAGENFAGLASKHSDDTATKAKGGDLGFFGEGTMAREFEKAALALKPGEIGGPVRTDFGYHLIKVEERRESYRYAYDNVKGAIRERLLKQKQKERVAAVTEELKKKVKTETNLSVFDAE